MNVEVFDRTDLDLISANAQDVALPEEIAALHGWPERLPESEPAVVAVMDSGIHASVVENHPWFEGAEVVGRYDAAGAGTPRDKVGHGTGVASLIARMAPAVEFVDVRIFGSDTRTGFNVIRRAYEWLIDRAGQIDIVNMSWGARRNVMQINQLHERLIDAGVHDVVAAGNTGTDGGSPATSGVAFSAGALDEEGTPARFSSFDPDQGNPDVAAIGVNVKMARTPGTEFGNRIDARFTKGSGTSFAAPLTSAAYATLLAAERSDWDQRLVDGAEDIEGTPRDGAGVLKMPKDLFVGPPEEEPPEEPPDAEEPPSEEEEPPPSEEPPPDEQPPREEPPEDEQVDEDSPDENSPEEDTPEEDPPEEEPPEEPPDAEEPPEEEEPPPSPEPPPEEEPPREKPPREQTPPTTPKPPKMDESDLYVYRARVVEVIDGDTVDLEVELGFRTKMHVRMRVAGVDTGEVFFVEEESDEFEKGQIHKAFTADYLYDEEGNPHDLLFESYEEGYYGRWVGDVIRDGAEDSLSEALIDEFPDVVYEGEPDGEGPEDEGGDSAEPEPDPSGLQSAEEPDADPASEQDTDNVDLEAISGVGPARAESLREAGYEMASDVATATAGDLSEDIGISEKVAQNIIDSAHEV